MLRAACCEMHIVGKTKHFQGDIQPIDTVFIEYICKLKNNCHPQPDSLYML